jgi:hypothetical protein
VKSIITVRNSTTPQRIPQMANGFPKQRFGQVDEAVAAHGLISALPRVAR